MKRIFLVLLLVFISHITTAQSITRISLGDYAKGLYYVSPPNGFKIPATGMDITLEVATNGSVTKHMMEEVLYNTTRDKWVSFVNLTQTNSLFTVTLNIHSNVDEERILTISGDNNVLPLSYTQHSAETSSPLTSNITLGSYVTAMSHITPAKNINVSAKGQDVTFRITTNGSVSKQIIEDIFNNAIFYTWTRLVSITQSGNMFTVVTNFLENKGRDRILNIQGGNNLEPLRYFQPGDTYILPAGEFSYVPTEIIDMTLYNTTLGTSYLLFNGFLPHTPYFYVYGTGGNVKYQLEPKNSGVAYHLLYSNVIVEGPRFYPYSVCIQGSPLVSEVKNVELDPNGGEYRMVLSTLNSPVPYNEMSNVAKKVTSGVVKSWDSRMGLRVEETVPQYLYDITVIYPPNLGNEEILNASPYMTTVNGSGAGFNTIFRQPPGGRLEIYDVELVTINEFNFEYAITLNGSQHNVEYVLKRNGIDLTAVKGTGGVLRFDLYSPGTYSITARLDGHTLEMNGTHVFDYLVNPYLPGSYQNYVLKKVYTNKMGTMGYGELAHLDDLGFPTQTIQINSSQNGHSLYQQIEYDAAGRDDVKVYLPYVRPRSGFHDWNSLINQKSYYAEAFPDDYEYAYAEKIYEASPMNRPVAVIEPGAVYRNNNKYTTYEYGLNEDYEVRKFNVSSGELMLNGYYEAGVLFKVSMINEDSMVSHTFTDHFENVILERTITSDISTETYYVYDYRNRLRYVLPPELSASINISGINDLSVDAEATKNFAYVYNYDHRNNCTEKRLPGGAWEYFIYDKQGKVLMEQDGRMRLQNRWLIYEYDPLQRISNTWVSSPINLQVDDLRMSVEAQGTSQYRWAKIEQKFYDNYDYPDNYFKTTFLPIPDIVDNSDYDERTRNLVTFESKRIINESFDNDESGPVSCVYFYDYRNRLIQCVEQNHLGGISRESYKYDFAGNILTKHESHQKSAGGEADILLTEYTYDPRGRVINEKTCLNNGEPVSLSYSYDNFGKLLKSRLESAAGKPEIYYKYNIQGWLTEKTSPLLDMKFKYYDPIRGTNPSYTGNITEWEWQHIGEGTSQIPRNTYAFAYDGLSRLTHTVQYEGSGTAPVRNFVEEGITYDFNGNIRTLRRYAGGQVLHDLSNASYEGNMLLSIENGSSVYDYEYDSNGNMIRDGRQGVELDYNYMNLVSLVKAPETSSVKARYTWLSDGRKLSVTTGDGMNGYEYMGSLVYQRTNGVLSLESAVFGGGRIIASDDGSGTVYTPNYFLTDHLGSVRAVVDNTGNAVSRHDYYPFGLSWSNPIMSTGTNRYLYNGKELESIASLDLLNYGARMYDVVLGRWPNVDRLAEMFEEWSPYSFSGNNPIINIDHNGMAWTTINDDSAPVIEIETIVVEGYQPPKLGEQVMTPLNGFWKHVGNFVFGNRVYAYYPDVNSTQPVRYDVDKQGKILYLTPNTGTAPLPGARLGKGSLKATKAVSSLRSVFKNSPDLLKALKGFKFDKIGKGGKIIGEVKGNAQTLFSEMTRNATKVGNNSYRLSSGTTVTLYTSSGGPQTVYIHCSQFVMKLRIIP